MRTQRLGCLTPIGLTAGIITALLISGAIWLGGGSIFSPGKLNDVKGAPLGGYNSHAETVGKCENCHTAPWDTTDMTVRCLQCHEQLMAELADPKTLHGELVKDAANVNCLDCHTEHHGPEASLTRLDIHDFPHDVTGFALTAHRKMRRVEFQCKDCHQDFTRVKNPVCSDCHTRLDRRAMASHKAAFGLECRNCHDGIDTYGAAFDHNIQAFPLKGKHAQIPCDDCHLNQNTLQAVRATPMDCASCHLKDDAHGGGLGTDCASCHTSDGWKPTTFDHNTRTKFPLLGKHIEVKCDTCHINHVYKGTSSDCKSCHAKDDAHKGGLPDCATCHDPKGWKPARFDHNTNTKFELVGKHLEAKCDGCHATGVFKGTPTDCVSCHKEDDFHKGQYGTDCGLCHKPTAWKPSTFDHNTGTKFPLQGKHIGVDCLSCHQDAKFKGTPMNCAACHTSDDPHQGKLGSACDSCHTVNGWKPSTFDHSRSSFKLTGKHASAQCGSCHKDLLFKGTPQSCAGCHSGQDPHKGALGPDCSRCHTTQSWKPSTFNHNQAAFQLTGRHISVNCNACHVDMTFKGTPGTCYACHQKNDTHNGSMGTECSACHSTNAWKPSTFDHNRAAFKLTGAHAGVACSSCHPGGSFKGTPSDCYSCHKNDDAHSGSMGTGCSSCHSTSAWKPSTFNHNNSGFPLTGAHSSLACSRCHSGGNFAGVSTACAACHAEPAIHAGVFGTDCAGCHNTSAWQPASYNGPHSFPMSHGNANGCRDCHTTSYSTYDCFHCHNQNEMNDKHKEVTGFTYDCLQCHADGRKHD